MNESLKFHFVKPGLLTTVQDNGRPGHQAAGIPLNGVMDKQSARQANWLVGNEPGAPVLEITLLGPTIRVEGNGFVAITGANLSPALNGEPMSMFETVPVVSDDLITFGRPVNGCRSYLGVTGNWQVTRWLGSASASALSPEILTPDSTIDKGSVLGINASETALREVPEEDRPVLDGLYKIRVLPGPEFSQASNLSVASFFSQDFVISNDSNRMGYRLKGEVAHFNPQQEVISSGIVPGTIQLTNSGQPIVLMADAQTSGGYFRLANVVSEDLDLLAQMKPGELVRFVLA